MTSLINSSLFDLKNAKAAENFSLSISLKRFVSELEVEGGETPPSASLSSELLNRASFIKLTSAVMSLNYKMITIFVNHKITYYVPLQFSRCCVEQRRFYFQLLSRVIVENRVYRETFLGLGDNDALLWGAGRSNIPLLAWF